MEFKEAFKEWMNLRNSTVSKSVKITGIDAFDVQRDGITFLALFSDTVLSKKKIETFCAEINQIKDKIKILFVHQRIKEKIEVLTDPGTYVIDQAILGYNTSNYVLIRKLTAKLLDDDSTEVKNQLLYQLISSYVYKEFPLEDKSIIWQGFLPGKKYIIDPGVGFIPPSIVMIQTN